MTSLYSGSCGSGNTSEVVMEFIDSSWTVQTDSIVTGVREDGGSAYDNMSSFGWTFTGRELSQF